MTERRTAHVVGTGLIGGSVALSLANAGWRVTGADATDFLHRITANRVKGLEAGADEFVLAETVGQRHISGIAPARGFTSFRSYHDTYRSRLRVR